MCKYNHQPPQFTRYHHSASSYNQLCNIFELDGLLFRIYNSNFGFTLFHLDLLDQPTRLYPTIFYLSHGFFIFYLSSQNRDLWF